MVKGWCGAACRAGLVPVHNPWPCPILARDEGALILHYTDALYRFSELAQSSVSLIVIDLFCDERA